MPRKSLVLALLALALLVAGCGDATSEQSASTTDAPPAQPGDTAVPPEALAFTADDPAEITPDCAAVDSYVLTPYGDDDITSVLDAIDRLKPALGSDRADVADNLETIKALYQAASPNPADLDVAFDTLMAYDRATYEACGVPVLSALEHMVDQTFACVSADIGSTDDECEPRTWATIVPCFTSVETPGRPSPFQYTPIDCDTQQTLRITADGTWAADENPDGSTRFSVVSSEIIGG